MQQEMVYFDEFMVLSRHHNRFTALFRDHPGEPVPEENF